MEIVERLLKYDGWAIGEALRSLRSATSTNRRAARYLAHLLVAEKVWCMRLNGEETSWIDLAPDLSPDQCEELAEKNAGAYAAFLSDISPEKLNSLVSYKNSKGVEFETSVQDVLLHVLMHGAYHRGQIAAALRAEGDEPVNTDYITFTRVIE